MKQKAGLFLAVYYIGERTSRKLPSLQNIAQSFLLALLAGTSWVQI